MNIKDQRPGSPLENQLLDIAFSAVFGPRQISDASLKVNCPHCGKTVKAVGLEQHIRDVHLKSIEHGG